MLFVIPVLFPIVFVNYVTYITLILYIVLHCKFIYGNIQICDF